MPSVDCEPGTERVSQCDVSCTDFPSLQHALVKRRRWKGWEAEEDGTNQDRLDLYIPDSDPRRCGKNGDRPSDAVTIVLVKL